MRNVRPYQSTRRRSSSGDKPKLGRWVMAAAVVVLGFFVLRGNGADAPSSSTTPENTNSTIPALLSDVNRNTNTTATTANTNANTIASTNASTCTGVHSSVGTAKRVALTFNSSGLTVGSAEALRDQLKNAGVGGSFFLTGMWVEENLDLTRSLSEAGFGVYNYTYSRPHPAAITAEELTEELSKATSAIQLATGKNPQPYFRPPYGEFNTAVTATVEKAGYCIIHWTVDAYDYQEGQTVDGSAQRVLERAKPGAIVLLNLNSDIVVELTSRLITDLRSAGYELVGIDQLFRN